MMLTLFAVAAVKIPFPAIARTMAASVLMSMRSCQLLITPDATIPAISTAMGMPSRYKSLLPTKAGSLDPGVRIPTRLSGSAPDTDTH